MLTVKTPEEVYEVIKKEFMVLGNSAEWVDLDDACGKILSNDILSKEYIPDFNRSTVDGYAVKASDTFGCSDSIPAILSLIGEVHMGQSAEHEIKDYCCIYVPTGGEVPKGADAVVMIEYAEDYNDGTIGILKPTAPGNNIIFRGDDVTPDEVVLAAGRKLLPQDIGTLAALGIHKVLVQKKTIIGIISTGDELVSVEKKPEEGQIRDVNSGMLRALINYNDISIAKSYGIIKDQKELLEQTVKKAVKECDVVLISGGSSVGMKDVTCNVIESFGEILFHGIAMKPGKPTIFGKVNGKPVIGLPGNPVAAFFVTELFIKPLIRSLNGEETTIFHVSAILRESVSSNHGRAEYVGVNLKKENGKVYAYPIRSKSGLITSLAGSDGYFCIERNREGVAEGTDIKVILYNSL